MAKYSRLPKKKENEKVRKPTFHVIFHFIYLSSFYVFLLRICGIEGILMNFFFSYTWIFKNIYSESLKETSASLF